MRKGGTLSLAELALLTGCLPTRVGQLLREYEARTGEVIWCSITRERPYAQL